MDDSAKDDMKSDEVTDCNIDSPREATGFSTSLESLPRDDPPTLSDTVFNCDSILCVSVNVLFKCTCSGGSSPTPPENKERNQGK